MYLLKLRVSGAPGDGANYADFDYGKICRYKKSTGCAFLYSSSKLFAGKKEIYKLDHDFSSHLFVDGNAGFFDFYDYVSAEGTDDCDGRACIESEVFKMTLDFITAADFFYDLLFSRICKN